MSEPLSGIRVVEMAVAVQGPAASLYLRDMGAEVVKVEPPIGDPSRYGRGHDNDTPPGTLGPQFVAVNRGKRSVCVDLTTELGRRAVLALLDSADVFLTNYREEALERLGLGYETLHERCPRLIYASVNGFGPKGPDADRAMLDGAAVARGGLSHATGARDGPPMAIGAVVGDTAGAMHLALATLTALYARERTGSGQRVQTSALGTQLWLQQWEL
ncbi:MAG TPA: CoA transferase, partial [Pseudomonadales bacterium]